MESIKKPIFLDEDPRLSNIENIKKKKELEELARGKWFIIGYIPVIINIDGDTEKFEPLIELYTALKKINKQIFKLDVALFQNNHLAFHEGEKTELIELRFETSNSAEMEKEDLSSRFNTVFPTIKLLFKDLINLWIDSPIGYKKYMDAFKKRSIKEAEEAIDNFLIAEGLKKAKKTKKPAK